MSDNPYESPSTSGERATKSREVPISRMNAMELVALLGGWFVTMIGVGVGALIGMGVGALALGIVERLGSGNGNRAFFLIAPLAVLVSAGVCGKLTAWGYKRAYAGFIRQLLSQRGDDND